MRTLLEAKKDGKVLYRTEKLSKETAVQMQREWQENGAHIVLDDQRQHVFFDSVEVTELETLWSR